MNGKIGNLVRPLPGKNKYSKNTQEPQFPLTFPYAHKELVKTKTALGDFSQEQCQSFESIAESSGKTGRKVKSVSRLKVVGFILKNTCLYISSITKNFNTVEKITTF